MKRRLILHEKLFPRYKFFTSYLIDGRVFFRIFTFYIVFDDDWERVYKYTIIIRENYVNVRDQKRDEHGASFQ